MGVCRHSLMQPEAIFSVKKEAKSPAESRMGRRFWKLEGKKCEIIQENRKVKGFRK